MVRDRNAVPVSASQAKSKSLVSWMVRDQKKTVNATDFKRLNPWYRGW